MADGVAYLNKLASHVTIPAATSSLLTPEISPVHQIATNKYSHIELQILKRHVVIDKHPYAINPSIIYAKQ